MGSIGLFSSIHLSGVPAGQLERKVHFHCKRTVTFTYIANRLPPASWSVFLTLLLFVCDYLSIEHVSLRL